jgi:hypothetical protein
LKSRKRKLEADWDGKRASEKRTGPAKPGRDSGVSGELSAKWAKATGVLPAAVHWAEYSAKLPAPGAKERATEAAPTVGG